MSKIAWIEKQIETVNGFLAEDEANLSNKPNDFGLRLVVKNKRQHLDTLRHDLMLAQSERSKEVMELRFISPGMDRGAISLRFLSKISGPLHRFLAAGAYHIRHGKDFAKGIQPTWDNLLDIRLAGISYGSTRLYLTGNVTPDLAGDSALQDSLTEIFQLLNSPSEELFSAVHRLGPAATKGLAEFLSEIEKERTSAEFGWVSPDDQTMHWDGHPNEITRLRALLESVEANARHSEETVLGVVTMLSASGRIWVVPEGEIHKIVITYPKGLPEWVAGISLHQRILAPVEKTTWFDAAADKDRSLYALTGAIIQK